jgi:hypothetical protein
MREMRQMRRDRDKKGDSVHSLRGDDLIVRAWRLLFSVAPAAVSDLRDRATPIDDEQERRAAIKQWAEQHHLATAALIRQATIAVEAWRALPGHAHHLICWYDASSRSSAVAGVNAEDDSAAIWAEPNFETYEEFLERAARHWKSRVDDVEREQTEQKQQTDVKSVGRLQRRQIDDERLRWFLQHQVWGVPAWGLAEQSNYDRDESTIRKAIAIVARAIKIPLRPQHGRHKRRK